MKIQQGRRPNRYSVKITRSDRVNIRVLARELRGSRVVVTVAYARDPQMLYVEMAPSTAVHHAHRAINAAVTRAQRKGGILSTLAPRKSVGRGWHGDPEGHARSADRERTQHPK